MIDFLALRTAEHIKRKVPEHPASIAILKHSLSIIINMAMIIILTLVISIFTSRIIEVIIIMIVFAILRQLTGGYHLKSGMACVVVSTLLFCVLSLIYINQFTTLIFTILTVILLFFYAPSRIEEQSRIPKKYYNVLKLVSIGIVSINFIFLYPVVAIAMLAQAVTLIRR